MMEGLTGVEIPGKPKDKTLNLLDCGFAYFEVGEGLLSLRPTELKTALKVLRDTSGRSLVRLEEMTAKDRRLLEDVRQGMQGGKHFLLPSRLDFDRLTHAATKTLIACYALSRYSRTPFRFVRTREELAEAAHLSLPHLRRALKELEEEALLEIKPIWRKGIQVSLLDPEFRSGSTLYHIAEFHRERFDSMDPHRWYQLMLHDDYIPRDTRQEWSDHESDYVVEYCPFCGHKKSFRLTLILNEEKTDYDKEMWYCHNCKKGGDVKRLWGRLGYYIGRTNWLTKLGNKWTVGLLGGSMDGDHMT